MTARQKKLIQGCCIFNIFIILGYARDGKGIYIMNYAEIKECDVANGPGVRVSLFVSGCTHHCKECFNPETWDFNYGKPFTGSTEDKISAQTRLHSGAYPSWRRAYGTLQPAGASAPVKKG